MLLARLRLPCAQILRAPDFLALFIESCGITTLIPCASTCRAWRDAVDEWPALKAGAMIEQAQRLWTCIKAFPRPLPNDSPAAVWMARALLRAQQQSAEALAPHTDNLMIMFKCSMEEDEVPPVHTTFWGVLRCNWSGDLLMNVPAASLEPHAATLLGIAVQGGNKAVGSLHRNQALGLLQRLKDAHTGQAMSEQVRACAHRAHRSAPFLLSACFTMWMRARRQVRF